MPSTKARRPRRTIPKRAPAHAKRAQSSSREAFRPPEAWITDPQALLAAMAAGDRAQPGEAQSSRPARPSRDGGESRHTGDPVAAVESQPEPRPEPQPEPESSARPVAAPREEERIERRTDSGVVVIVRRRPAA